LDNFLGFFQCLLKQVQQLILVLKFLNLTIELEDLKKNILKQIEYYFSFNNLVNDSYLVSIMDSDYYVPLNTIYNFKRVKSLTTDTNLILEVLKTSTFLLLDKEFTKIKSSFNFQRRTCLIQGIPLNADFKV
jgi:hypothetical protein